MRQRSPVPDWVPAAIPPTAGVYQFEDGHGTVLYVGKSVNLRRRVRGYFYGGGPRNARLAEMLRLARKVEIRPTGTELEARLDEAERIVHGRPRYNRALKNRARGWYIEIDWSDPFPRLRIVRTIRRVTGQYFGPFRGRSVPAIIARLTEKVFQLRSCAGHLRPDPEGSPCLQYGLGLCTAPCTRAVNLDTYRKQVRAAARALEDGRYCSAVRDTLAARREARSRAMDYEGAADAQRRIDWIDELGGYRTDLERPRVDRSWLIVLPNAQAGRRVLVPIARGRVLPRRDVPWEEQHWVAAVEDACYAVRLAELRAESVFPPAALVASLIITEWLSAGAPEGTAIDLEDCDTDGVVAELSGSDYGSSRVGCAGGPDGVAGSSVAKRPGVLSHASNCSA